MTGHGPGFMHGVRQLSGHLFGHLVLSMRLFGQMLGKPCCILAIRGSNPLRMLPTQLIIRGCQLITIELCILIWEFSLKSCDQLPITDVIGASVLQTSFGGRPSGMLVRAFGVFAYVHEHLPGAIWAVPPHSLLHCREELRAISSPCSRAFT